MPVPVLIAIAVIFALGLIGGIIEEVAKRRKVTEAFTPYVVARNADGSYIWSDGGAR